MKVKLWRALESQKVLISWSGCIHREDGRALESQTITKVLMGCASAGGDAIWWHGGDAPAGGACEKMAQLWSHRPVRKSWWGALHNQQELAWSGPYNWACFLSPTWSKLRLCSANHRAGYFSSLACYWLSIVWAYSKQDIENGPSLKVLIRRAPADCDGSTVKWQSSGVNGLCWA